MMNKNYRRISFHRRGLALLMSLLMLLQSGAGFAEAAVVDESDPVSIEGSGLNLEGFTPQYFEGTLVHEGADYTVTAIIGQDAQFPQDVRMRVEEILPGTPQYREYAEMTDTALDGDWSEIDEFARFFDIAFLGEKDGEDVEIEPAAYIDVQITFKEAIPVAEDVEVQAVHFESKGAEAPSIIETSTDSVEAAVNDDAAIDTVSFSSDSFSVYGVVRKVKKILKVITANGDNYTIDVNYSQESGIPDNAELIATEITEDDPRYAAYRDQTAMALNADGVRMAGLFDIGVYVDGEKINIEAPVQVQISKEDTIAAEEPLYVVHFPEDLPEEVVTAAAEKAAEATGETAAAPAQETQAANAATPATDPATETPTEAPTESETIQVQTEVSQASVEGETASFEALGFSVYALAYTVDFHYVVDGQRYDVSIPGGGYISFAEIMELLHIPTARGASRDVEEWPEDSHGEAEKVLFIPHVAISDETKNFVSEIENIEFSSPNLVSVSKVEQSSTIGEIKERLGLVCEYSAELTEKNIEEINAQIVQAGDWVLISLLPFDTEEWLTVTMKNGETFSIKVTDAQIRKTVKSASGDFYEIIVTYNDTAEIPEDAELVVREILRDEEKYASNVEKANMGLAAMEKDGVENPVQFDISIVSAEGVEIEPREGSIVGVEIRLVPEIFLQPDEETVEEDGEPVPVSQVWFGGDVVADTENGEILHDFTVVHMTVDDSIEVIENLSSTIAEDERIILQFETESFSDYMVSSSSTSDLSNLPDTIYVGDEIYMYNSGNVWVTHIGTYVTETKHNNNSKYKTVTATNPGVFYLCTERDWYTWNNNRWRDYPDNFFKRITILPERSRPGLGAHPAEIETVSNASVGITLNLFDYDLDGYLDDRFNNYDYYNNNNTDVPISDFNNRGINANHTLKFLGSGNKNQNYGWHNEYTETNIRSGLVESRLSNGYPKLNGAESLDYLFTPNNGYDKRAYPNADGLFKKVGDYYVYDSYENYAYYNGSRFEVYNGTYYLKDQSNSHGETGPATNRKIGFFPFHEWDAQYDQFTSWNKYLNHHFGLSMSVEFNLPKDPKVVMDSEGNPIVFEFRGDDDMWVFIDDVLVMDIGGIHNSLTGQINFMNQTVTVTGNTQMDQATFRQTFANPNGINLYDGKMHTLKVFYIERGGCDSNCLMKFNLTQYGDLNFTKTGENGEALEGAIFGIYKDQACTQPLKEKVKAGSDGTEIAEREFIAVSDASGHVEFHDLPLGTFYLKEIYAPQGYNLDQEYHVSELKIQEVQGKNEVSVTLDNTVVNEYNVSITNKKTNVKVVKEWYRNSDDGDPVLITSGGAPVTMQLYRGVRASAQQDPSGTAVTFSRNGHTGNKPFVLNAENGIKTGDLIQIIVETPNANGVGFSMDMKKNGAYESKGAFGTFRARGSGTWRFIRTIDPGISEIIFGTWEDGIDEQTKVTVKRVNRPDPSAEVTNPETVGESIVLSDSNNWQAVVSGLDGTDADGNIYSYYFVETDNGNASSTMSSHETKTIDGQEVEVWTFKNYTEVPDGAVVKLKKRDRGRREDIAGVQFQIYDGDPKTGGTLINFREHPEWWDAEENKLIHEDGTTLESSSNGRFYYGFLPAGVYYIKETETIEHYKLPEHPFRITVSENSVKTSEYPYETEQTFSIDSTNKFFNVYFFNDPIETTEIGVRKDWVGGVTPTDASVEVKLGRYKLVPVENGDPGQNTDPGNGSGSNGSEGNGTTNEGGSNGNDSPGEGSSEESKPLTVKIYNIAHGVTLRYSNDSMTFRPGQTITISWDRSYNAPVSYGINNTTTSNVCTVYSHENKPGDGDTVTDSFTFTIPENGSVDIYSVDIYIDDNWNSTRDFSVTVNPTTGSKINGTHVSGRNSIMDMFFAPAYADDLQPTIRLNADITPPAVEGYTWVKDESWTAENSMWLNSSNSWTGSLNVDSVDSHGNLYVYYIKEVDEYSVDRDYWTVSIDQLFVWGDHATNTEHSNNTLSVTNTYTPPALGGLTIAKSLLEDGHEKAINGTFRFGIYDTAEPTKDTVPIKTAEIVLNNASTGKVTVSELRYGAYYVFELDGQGNPITTNLAEIGGIVYTVSSDRPENSVAINAYTGTEVPEITFINDEVLPINISVTKVWNNKNVIEWPDHVAKVVVGLYKATDDGEVPVENPSVPGSSYEIELTSDKQSASFENLPEYDEAGNRIAYSVKELRVVLRDGSTVDVNAGLHQLSISNGSEQQTWTVYEAPVHDDASTITNSISNANFTVKKEWLDIIDTSNMPDVYFNLKYYVPGDYEHQNDTPVQPENAKIYQNLEHIRLSADNNWTWSTDELLPTIHGRPVMYFAEEELRDPNRNSPDVYCAYTVEGQEVDLFDALQIPASLRNAYAIQLVGYANNQGVQTVDNYQQAYLVAIGNKGSITIRNRAPSQYMQMDIKKKFLEWRTDSNNVSSLYTVTHEDYIKKDLIIELQVMRRYIDERSGDFNYVTGWINYGNTFFIGYDPSGEHYYDNNGNVFRVLPWGGDWQFIIPNQSQNEGLPRRGFEIVNNKVTPVRYQYIIREVAVYDGNLNKLDAEWSAWLPYAWDPIDETARKVRIEDVPMGVAQDDDRFLNNIPATALTVSKEWIGGGSEAEQVYVKVYKNGTDLTKEMCELAAKGSVGTTGPDFFYGSYEGKLSTDHKALILSAGNEWTVTLHSLAIDDKDVYTIQEIGYKDETGDHMTQDDVQNYSPAYFKWDSTTNSWMEIGNGLKLSTNKTDNKLKVVNTSTPTTTDISILKVDNQNQPLTGATFALEMLTGESGEGTGVYTTVKGYGEIRVGTDGKAEIMGLTDGTYRLKETQAPNGYTRMTEPASFTITNGEVSYTAGSNSLVTYAKNDGENGVFTVTNNPGVELPATGGSGTLPYTLAGLGLILLAGAILVSRRRRMNG